MRKDHIGRRGRLTVTAMAALLSAAGWPSAHAMRFQSASGDWTGSFDVTLGYTQGWRESDKDCRQIAIANGGCGYSPNIDDGDLNYNKGAFTQALTGIAELGLTYQDKVGFLVRGSGLYDYYVMDRSTERTPLTHDAKEVVGNYGRLLDAFAFLRFDLGSMPSEIRLGHQVVNWGESTYIAGGLNSVNYFDVTALQVPGAELKAALLPDTMAILNMQLTKSLSTQLLYLFDWHEDIIEPTGAYFSTNDFAGRGGQQVFLGFGTISDQGVDFTSLGGSLIPNFQAVPRLADHKPSESGQYGLNFKLYLPNFGQGTQLGFYFLNYTSRLPVFSGMTGTQAGVGNAWGAINAVGGAAQALLAGLPFGAAVATAAAIGQQRAKAQGGNLSAATALQYATIGANTLLAGGNVNNQASSIATHEYAQTAGVFEEFPQDIKMIGLSFNSQVQSTGTALQGEIAYRHNVPLQIDDTELLYAALTPFEAGVARLLGEPVSPPGTCVKNSATPLNGCNQIGAFGIGQRVQGYKLMDEYHFGMTATQVFANVVKASQAVLLFEAGADYVPSLEEPYNGGPQGLGLRYDAPGTNLSGNLGLGSYPQFPTLVQAASAFPTKFSWGFVVAGRLEYDNVIAAWNVLPHVTWTQDVNGISPGPGGNFIQGRHAVTVGVGGSLRSRWDLDVSYTHYGGAGQFNLVNDRSFIAASVKVSF
jgi:hypothetical protein